MGSEGDAGPLAASSVIPASLTVIPAKAGIHTWRDGGVNPAMLVAWIPARLHRHSRESGNPYGAGQRRQPVIPVGRGFPVTYTVIPAKAGIHTVQGGGVNPVFPSAVDSRFRGNDGQGLRLPVNFGVRGFPLSRE